MKQSVCHVFSLHLVHHYPYKLYLSCRNIFHNYHIFKALLLLHINSMGWDLSERNCPEITDMIPQWSQQPSI